MLDEKFEESQTPYNIVQHYPTCLGKISLLGCTYNYANSLCIRISPIFFMANPNPNPAGPSMPQYRNYPHV